MASASKQDVSGMVGGNLRIREMAVLKEAPVRGEHFMPGKRVWGFEVMISQDERGELEKSSRS